MCAFKEKNGADRAGHRQNGNPSAERRNTISFCGRIKQSLARYFSKLCIVGHQGVADDWLSFPLAITPAVAQEKDGGKGQAWEEGQSNQRQYLCCSAGLKRLSFGWESPKIPPHCVSCSVSHGQQCPHGAWGSSARLASAAGPERGSARPLPPLCPLGAGSGPAILGHRSRG